MKKIMTNPKITASLGLIGGIVLLVSKYMYDSLEQDFFSYKWILESIFKIGIIIYFSIICIRLFMKKGNIKVANIILIGTLIIFDVLFLIYQNIISFLVFLIVLLYFVNILFGKKTYINHIVFLIDMLFYVVFNCYSVAQISDFASQLNLILPQYLAYLLIIPYFFGYYILLKEEDQNVK